MLWRRTEMLTKILTLALFCTCTLHVVPGASKPARSTEKDATAAFDELIDVCNSLMNNFTNEVNTMGANFSNELRTIHDKTLEEISTKAEEIERKRADIIAHLGSLEIGLCTFMPMKEFINTLSERITNCTRLSARTIGYMVSESRTEAGLSVVTTIMNCHARSLRECQMYARDDSCYDFVIKQIARARANMILNFELLTAKFYTRINSFKLPCQDLIEYEMSVGPSMQFQAVSDCIENQVQLYRPTTCSLYGL